MEYDILRIQVDNKDVVSSNIITDKKYSDVVVPKRIMTDTKTEKDVVVKS